MREGLLWFDPDPRRPPQARLEDALRRYRDRFGVEANCCHVAPGEAFEHPTVVVIGSPSMLPHHFLVGRDESLFAAQPRAREARKAAPPAPVVLAPQAPPVSVAPRRRARRSA